jgi:hypothetical protein
VVLGLAAGIFFGRFYFVRELVLLLILAMFLAFLVGNLVVLGILCRAAGQSILQSIRKAKPEIAAQVEANPEPQASPRLVLPQSARPGSSACDRAV